MDETITVRVTSFGEGRSQVQVPAGTATVREVLRKRGIEAAGRRVAVNGHPVELGSGVLEGDEVTVVPRVQGG